MPYNTFNTQNRRPQNLFNNGGQPSLNTPGQYRPQSLGNLAPNQNARGRANPNAMFNRPTMPFASTNPVGPQDMQYTAYDPAPMPYGGGEQMSPQPYMQPRTPMSRNGYLNQARRRQRRPMGGARNYREMMMNRARQRQAGSNPYYGMY